MKYNFVMHFDDGTVEKVSLPDEEGTVVIGDELVAALVSVASSATRKGRSCRCPTAAEWPTPHGIAPARANIGRPKRKLATPGCEPGC